MKLGGNGLALEEEKTLRRGWMRGATVPRSVKAGEACGTDCLDSSNVLLHAHRGSLAGLQLRGDAAVEAPPQLDPPSPN